MVMNMSLVQNKVQTKYRNDFKVGDIWVFSHSPKELCLILEVNEKENILRFFNSCGVTESFMLNSTRNSWSNIFCLVNHDEKAYWEFK